MDKQKLEEREDQHKAIFSSKLVSAMTYRGKSNIEISELTGLSIHTISLYRRGKSFYNVSHLKTIAEELNLKYEYFFDPAMSAQDADLLIEKKLQTQLDQAILNSLFKNPSDLNKTKQAFAQLIVEVDDPRLIDAMYELSLRFYDMSKGKA